MSFRIERKYKLNLSDQKVLKFCLFQKGLSLLYPSRIINSCYFDNNKLQCYSDSEDGCLPRKKIRFRWYKNDKQLYKETKFSTIEGRFKIIEKINNETFLKDFKSNIFDKDYGLLSPIQIIKYKREYFIFKGIRVTFDTDITYTDLKGILRKTYLDSKTVMELKAPDHISEDFVGNLVNMPTSRFSKYCRGISTIRGIFSY